jgi:polyisoprenoid-binding protein YceI
MTKTLLGLAALAIAAGAQAETYAIDPTHTGTTFEVDHFGASTNRGRLGAKEGTVEFDRAAKQGKVDVTIDTASLVTGVAPFDKHLKGKDFFNVAEHPTARFVGDKFVFNGDKVSEVSGSLTLLGKTHPVTLKATKFNCYQNPMLKREVCGGDFETTLQRSKWGMTYGLEYGFQDNIKMVVQVEAVKQ